MHVRSAQEGAGASLDEIGAAGSSIHPSIRQRTKREEYRDDEADEHHVRICRRSDVGDRRAGDPMTAVNANGVALGIESFGDEDAPLVLLAGGTTMLSWPDVVCEGLAAGGRRVVRYDLRESGESTTADPEAPAYTLRDLAADAAALADALGGGPAHLVGIGVGGMVAQVAASIIRGRSRRSPWSAPGRSLPGRPDDDVPDHDQATMSRLFAEPMPDWTDREAVAEFAAAGAEVLGDDPVARARSPPASGTARPARQPRSRWPTRWAWCSPRSTASPVGASACPRSRSPRSSSTAAGTRSSRSATARRSHARSPSRLLVLEEAATAIPDAAAGEVAEAMLVLR